MTRKLLNPEIDPNAVAYSLLRFSSRQQSEGDSYRRQTEGAKEWCQRYGIALDTSLWLFDPAVSAYTGKHRENPEKHALATFLKLVEKGLVRKGSYLVIENLDRLSREDERTALRVWMDLLDAGINIVQLQPETIFRHEQSDMFDIMRAIMELSRGHGESAIKSERVGAAWAEKKKRARAGKTQLPKKEDRVNGMAILTHHLPAWIEERDGKPVLIPERAAVIRRIFQLAANGYGMVRIVKKLIADNVPAFGRLLTEAEKEEHRRRREEAGKPLEPEEETALHLAGRWDSKPDEINKNKKVRVWLAAHWARSYIGTLIADRRPVGEFQPRTRDGKPDGDPIPNFFPPVVTEAEWYAVRAGASQRKKKPGRIGEHVNVFSGLLRDALDGGTVFAINRIEQSKRRRVLVNSIGFSGRGPRWTFPFATFEGAVLSLLAEIDPHEIMNGDGVPDETLSLAGQLAAVEAKISELERELLEGDVSAVVKVLRQQEAHKKALAEKLSEARQKAAHPLSEAWGSAKTLLEVIDTAPDPDEAKHKLRSLLRQMIESIWMLVVPRGLDRLAAVQVRFTGGQHCRSYLIYNERAKSNASQKRPGRWWVMSFSAAAMPNDLDLREPEHARELERALLAIDPLAPNGFLGPKCN